MGQSRFLLRLTHFVVILSAMLPPATQARVPNQPPATLRRRRPTRLALTAAAVLAVSTTAAPAAEPLRVLPMGDSITYGETAAGSGTGGGTAVAGGYRDPFFAALTAAGVAVQLVGPSTDNPSPALAAAGQAAHAGYRAWTVGDNVYSALDNLVFHAADWVHTYQPDVVLLHGGTNDLLMLAGSAKTLTNLRRLLDRIFTAKPGVRVFVAGIIPVTRPDSAWVTDWDIRPYNLSIADEVVPDFRALGRDIHFVDQFANFTVAGAPVSAHLPDGIHPDAHGYALMGATFADAAARSSVPEPASALVLALAPWLCGRRRRRC